MLRLFRVDLLQDLVVAGAIKMDAKTVVSLAMYDWPKFKYLMCRSRGVLKAMVIDEDGLVIRYTLYNGSQMQMSY